MILLWRILNSGRPARKTLPGALSRRAEKDIGKEIGRFLVGTAYNPITLLKYGSSV